MVRGRFERNKLVLLDIISRPLLLQWFEHLIGMKFFLFVCFFVVFLGGMWDFIVLIPDHCLSIYFY